VGHACTLMVSLMTCTYPMLCNILHVINYIMLYFISRRILTVITAGLCVSLLWEFSSITHSAKTRCGWELVADLEFVCGDRGFYRATGSGYGRTLRSRGKGIVENCCVRGCDLQHLEKYCATTPKRGRRNTPLPLEQTLVRPLWMNIIKYINYNQE
uniref:Insulin-like domain-containing protein n=1 Tax=Denticeps clupeoides TaxID=299321 RepID=A0AAY4EIF8_9TELE